jgi:hypothetical protein
MRQKGTFIYCINQDDIVYNTGECSFGGGNEQI